MRRVSQISSAHCGPAVVKMLMSFYGVSLYQRDLVRAAGAEKKLKTHGMTVAELGLAVRLTAPALQFWYKDYASFQEMAELLTSYGVPVGVEWQGVFEEYADDDDGHYAVVTHLNLVEDVILLADPFKKYAGRDREFRVSFFKDRWWDTNEIIDPQTGHGHYVKDERLMFVVVPQEASWPERLAMKRG